MGNKTKKKAREKKRPLSSPETERNQPEKRHQHDIRPSQKQTVSPVMNDNDLTFRNMSITSPVTYPVSPVNMLQTPTAIPVQVPVQQMQQMNGAYSTPIQQNQTCYQPSFTQLYTPQQQQQQQNQLAAAASSPASQTNMLLNRIESRLDNIDSKLKILDSLESKICNINDKVKKIDGRVSSLENKIMECNKTISELQESRNFDSKVCEEIKKVQNNVKDQLSAILKENETITTHMKKLDSEKERLNETILDLQSRSMRDNLLFYGFAECRDRDERSTENCEEKVRSFCEKELKIDMGQVKVDRAHRIGRYNADKTRAIVVKFNFYQDKLKIKQASFSTLKGTSFGVSEQYPREIQERRKQLYPVMKSAKDAGHRAVLSYDKLYINGQLYMQNSVNPFQSMTASKD